MLDGASLVVAAVEEGSFLAAARRLNRAQSAVSELVGNLEAQLGVSLFDRSGRYAPGRRRIKCAAEAHGTLSRHGGYGPSDPTRLDIESPTRYIP